MPPSIAVLFAFFVNVQSLVVYQDSVMTRNIKKWDADWMAPNLIYEKKGGRTVPSPFFKHGDPRPHPPQKQYKDEEVANASTIVVLVAALREKRVVKTLESLFQNADHPERVFVGLVQQNAPEDGDAIETLCKKRGTPLQLRHPSMKLHHKRAVGEEPWGQTRFTAESLAACEPAARVRTFRMDHHEAAGPVFARAHQRSLIQQGDGMEDFCLQIDAHTNFGKGWDSGFIQDFAATENDYAVLTSYPADANQFGEDMVPPNINGHWEMPILCNAKLAGGGLVVNEGAGACANLQTPVLSKFWGAGLSFSRCHAERDVPADPHLKQIFAGEEFSRAARLWTNGYDFYGNTKPWIGTYYGNEKGGKDHWDNNDKEQRASKERLDLLLTRPHEASLMEGQESDSRESLSGYDLGNRRSLEAYIQLTGMDTINQVGENTNCIIKRWTPWRDGATPPYEPAQHPGEPPL